MLKRINNVFNFAQILLKSCLNNKDLLILFR